MATVEERSIEIDGVTTHCLLAGPPDGPRLVFVPGLSGSLTTWALNLAAFMGQFRICALDLVGTSENEQERDYSVPALVEFLARFLEKLGPDWQRAHLIGHSLGGAVALAYVHRFPMSVGKLVLVNSMGLGEEFEQSELEYTVCIPDPEQTQKEIESFFYPMIEVETPFIERIKRRFTEQSAREATLALLNANIEQDTQKYDLRHTLATLPCPTRVIWGTADRIIPSTHAYEVTRQAAIADIDLFVNSRHCPHIDSSGVFNQTVIAFLL